VRYISNFIFNFIFMYPYIYAGGAEAYDRQICPPTPDSYMRMSIEVSSPGLAVQAI